MKTTDDAMMYLVVATGAAMLLGVGVKVVAVLIQRLEAEPIHLVGPPASIVWTVGLAVAAFVAVVFSVIWWGRSAPVKDAVIRAQARFEGVDPVAALTHLAFYSRTGGVTLDDLVVPQHRLMDRVDASITLEACARIETDWAAANDSSLEAIIDPRRRELALRGLGMLTGAACSETDRAIAARLILAADIPQLPAAATATLQQWVDRAPEPVWPTSAELLAGTVTEPATTPILRYPSRRWSRWRGILPGVLVRTPGPKTEPGGEKADQVLR